MSQEPSSKRGNRFFEGFRPLVEPSPRWIRAKFGGVMIADSKRALLLIQYAPGRLPTYYFPQADVRINVDITLIKIVTTQAGPSRG